MTTIAELMTRKPCKYFRKSYRASGSALRGRPEPWMAEAERPWMVLKCTPESATRRPMYHRTYA